MSHGEPELLRNVPAADAARVLALGRTTQLASGDVLFGLGAAAEGIFLIRQGRIALTLPIKAGGRDEDILVEERVPGQTVGWSGLIPPHRFTLKATALLATEVLVLPRAALLDHFASHPETGYAVVANVAAIVGQRLQVFQAMWLREIQRVVEYRAV